MSSPHGTLARAKHGPDQDGTPGRRCTCFPCRKAANDHHVNRKHLIACGQWNPLVPAGPARDHLRWLSGQGIGYRQAARMAGVPVASVHAILYARKDRERTRRIRPEREAAILAVRPHLDHLADTTPVDPAGTHRRMQAMAVLGWPVKTQAAMTGVGDLRHVLARDRVQAGTARKVRVLYDELCGRRPVPPPAGTRYQRSAVTRTRKWAAAQGWAPPGAWDDMPGPHCIDDPAARPAPGWRQQEAV